MTNDHHWTWRCRSIRAGLMSAATLSLALGALPMAAANPALATTEAQATNQPSRDREGRCDVDANKPTKADRGRVNYSFEFKCPRGYRVQVEQRMYEADDEGDQFTSGPYRYRHHFGKNRYWEKSIDVRAPNTERGDEEVYHVVRYREYDRDGDVSRWYKEKSPTTTIRQHR